MPKHLAVRPLTEAETAAVKRLAHRRTAAARLVERARIIWLSAQGRRVPAIAAEVGCSAGTARLWLRRFDAANGAARAGRCSTASSGCSASARGARAVRPLAHRLRPLYPLAARRHLGAHSRHAAPDGAADLTTQLQLKT